jgi:hypothetical protein
MLRESDGDALVEGAQVQQQGLGADLADLTGAYTQGPGVQSGRGPPDLLVPLLVGEVFFGGGQFTDQMGAAQLMSAVRIARHLPLEQSDQHEEILA